MEPAKQNTVCNIGASSVAVPVLNVVGLAPRWWLITAGEAGSAIPRREPGAQARREESAIAAYIDALAIIIELDTDDAVFAYVAAEGLESHCI